MGRFAADCGLPVVVKGVLTPEDARRALDSGAAGIVVSNHGGRQLDGVPATLDALPEVIEAVDGRVEVYVDGGIRRGTDVLKALALGAHFVFVGRPFLYATTKEFLIRFGLNDLSDLPKVEDMAEALGFDPPAGLTEQTPREEMLPLDDDDCGRPEGP